MKKALFTIVLFVIFIVNSEAQKAPMKFGKIDKANLAMTVYEKDTSAAAVVLCDYGRSHFEYNVSQGRFKVHFDRHARIKILDHNGVNWADISIPFYNDLNLKEHVAGIKAYTYNSENGKMTKDKLGKGAQFTEKTSKNWSTIKFTLPNVKEGSIIEFKYTIISDDVFNFHDWQFQYSIPVIWSEFITDIPEYYTYNKTTKGYESLFIDEFEEISDNIAITTKTSKVKNQTTRKTSYSVNQIDFIRKHSRKVMKDIPAFKSESFMTASNNFISKIEFELASITQRNGAREDYTNTWESINEKLMRNKYFGQQFSGDFLAAGSAFMKDDIESINNKYNSSEEKMVAAFEFIKNYMKWDGYYGKYVTSNLRKAYKDMSGNVADINLLLVLMLQELDIDVVPVMLSTRNNGVIFPVHPVLTKFNYVVANVTIDGSRYFLDATDPLHAVGMLPFRCLNGKGRIVSNRVLGWMELENVDPKYTMSMYDLKIGEDGTISGKSQSSRKNYAALEFRKSIQEKNSQDEFIEDLEDSKNGLDVTSYTFGNLDNVYKPIIEKYEMTISDQVEVMGDMMYFSPMLYDQVKENPFKLENRKFPVDYGYKISESNIYKFTIPEGYAIEEKPENIAMSLPDRTARFTYNVTQMGNVIQIMSKFYINKAQFLPTEYLALKNFYNQIIAKHAEQVILKKKTE